ncbi:unnamed protein product [Miscanthus lutarioriparius]|uniref:Hexosyltransferase n=1 Tax=Miscanthus lutarioriparius TaxID=422564 RepID=A0A811PZM6_9POAL|nr:unnamed protein product [Miscanthus lutarioriparius]
MDYDTELGHDGVSQLDDDRRSVSDRSSESTVSNDNVLWNGEEMKEVESHDPVKRERVDDITTARKQISHGGDVEVRRHKATTMHGNSSGSLKKENTVDRSSKQFAGATSEGSDSKAVTHSINRHASLPDATIRTIKDQLRRARTYIRLLPSRGRHAFVRDLRRKMRDVQQALGDATSDRWLPKNVSGKIRAMELALTKNPTRHVFHIVTDKHNYAAMRMWFLANPIGKIAIQDLSNLWSIDLKGKVNGAVHTCGATFHRFDRYLNFSNPLIARQFDQRACGWAYGMNMFDLSEWRKQDITDVYHYWQNMNANRQLWKLGTLPAGLVTFWNRTFPLDRSWHLLGLGYKPNVDQRDIERAAVLHYNGNRKPWLEIGLPRYRKFWSKYVNFDHAFLRECNIHP